MTRMTWTNIDAGAHVPLSATSPTSLVASSLVASSLVASFPVASFPVASVNARFGSRPRVRNREPVADGG